MRTLLTSALFVLLALSGCTGGEPTDSVQTGTDSVRLGDQPEPQEAPEEIPEAGTDPHGEPVIVQSDTEAEMQTDGTWRAWYTVNITNGVGEFQYTRTDYGASSGHVNIVGEERGGYAVLVQVESRGVTEDQARQALEASTVVHTDEVEEDTLVLSTEVEVEDAVPPIVPGLPDINIGGPTVSYSFDVALPSHMSHDIWASASSGSVFVGGVHGSAVQTGASSGSVTIVGVQAGTISAGTSSGGVEISDCVANNIDAGASSGSVTITDCSTDGLDVGASSGQIEVTDVVAANASLGASSGQITVSGAFGDLSASTSSGSVDAILTPAASGRFDFGASSGSLRLQLADSYYDVEASVSSGSINIDLPNSEEVGEQSRNYAHVRTIGYDDADIQTVVDLGASSGSIGVGS